MYFLVGEISAVLARPTAWFHGHPRAPFTAFSTAPAARWLR